jgi:hypothetical protein
VKCAHVEGRTDLPLVVTIYALLVLAQVPLRTMPGDALDRIRPLTFGQFPLVSRNHLQR